MLFDATQQSTHYVADYITRIEGRHASDRNLTLDSKWRIASYCNMEDLGVQLTLEQEKEVDKFIADFKIFAPKKIARYRSKNQ